ncbi:MAG: LuxR C-terminal-related transcriptional regulator [Chloroflexota bacterium]
MIELAPTASTEKTRGDISRLLDAISHTTDGVYAVDETHRIILWNAGASRILGHAAADVLGKLCYEVLAGRDEKGTLVCQGGCADMALAGAGALVPTRDLLTRTKDGRQIWMNVTNILVPSDLGGLSTVVHIFREVTAQHKTEQLVQRLSSLMKSFAVSQGTLPNTAQDAPTRPLALTSRERQVLSLLAEGSNATSIAQALVISPATVRKHIQHVLKKLGVHTTLEAVAYTSRHNLLSSFAD